jgi:hypothetical protein
MNIDVRGDNRLPYFIAPSCLLRENTPKKSTEKFCFFFVVWKKESSELRALEFLQYFFWLFILNVLSCKYYSFSYMLAGESNEEKNQYTDRLRLSGNSKQQQRKIFKYSV